MKHQEILSILTKELLYNEYILEHKSSNAIAKEHGMNSSTVLQYLRKYGIKIRSNSENRKGTHATLETRQKMSLSHRGINHPMYGKHHTEESKRKNSEAHKGVKLSEEQKQKISKSCIGKNSGNKNGMYGRTGEKNPFYGKHHTEETLNKISAHRKGSCVGINNTRYGKPPAPGAGRGKGSYFIKLDGTQVWLRSTYETRFAKAITQLNYEWNYECKSFKLESNSSYRPDFYLSQTDCWFEVKGYVREEAREKLISFHKLYPEINIRIVYGSNIKELEYMIGQNIVVDIMQLGIALRDQIIEWTCSSTNNY